MSNAQAREQARDRLVHEGIASYLDAYIALQEFEREIHNVCREVVERRRNELAEALGVTIDEDSIEEYLDPKRTGFKRENSRHVKYIGAKLSIKKMALDMRFYLYLVQNDQGSVIVQMIGDVLPGALISKYAPGLLSKPQQFGKNNEKDMWLQTPIPPEESPSLDDKLQRLIDSWIKIWEHVGGLKNNLK